MLCVNWDFRYTTTKGKKIPKHQYPFLPLIPRKCWYSFLKG